MRPIPSVNMARTGQNITDLRKTAGMTVRELQDLLGFTTPQSIYKWQQGVSLPGIDNLVALASIFRVSIDDIIATNGDIKHGNGYEMKEGSCHPLQRYDAVFTKDNTVVRKPAAFETADEIMAGRSAGQTSDDGIVVRKSVIPASDGDIIVRKAGKAASDDGHAAGEGTSAMSEDYFVMGKPDTVVIEVVISRR